MGSKIDRNKLHHSVGSAVRHCCSIRIVTHVDLVSCTLSLKINLIREYFAIMNIIFQTNKLSKILNNQSNIKKHYGDLAPKIQQRLLQLQAAQSLADLGPPYQGPARCHELKGNRAGQLSVDLEHPHRLLFRPDHDPLPQRQEGGLDWSQVTRIKILSVEDTHE